MSVLAETESYVQVLYGVVAILAILAAIFGVKLKAADRAMASERSADNIRIPDVASSATASNLEDALLDIVREQEVTWFSLASLACQREPVNVDRVHKLVRASAGNNGIPKNAVKRALRIMTYGPLVKVRYSATDEEQYEITQLGMDCHGKMLKRGNRRRAKPSGEPTTELGDDEEDLGLHPAT